MNSFSSYYCFLIWCCAPAGGHRHLPLWVHVVVVVEGLKPVLRKAEAGRVASRRRPGVRRHWHEETWQDCIISQPHLASNSILLLIFGTWIDYALLRREKGRNSKKSGGFNLSFRLTGWGRIHLQDNLIRALSTWYWLSKAIRSLDLWFLGKVVSKSSRHDPTEMGPKLKSEISKGKSFHDRLPGQRV